MKAQKAKLEGFAEAEVMRAKGYNQKDVLQAEVQKAYAEGIGNMGSGGGNGSGGNSLPANAKFCLECGTKIETLAENELICPACGKKTLKGKFCLECGAPLVKTCPNCGTQIPHGGKFCLECGTKID